MKIQLTFDAIVDNPQCRILINDQQLYEGVPPMQCEFDVPVASALCCLTIVHWDKKPEHTVVENGRIVRDRSFELTKCVIDDYDLQELIWMSHFVATTGEIYKSCLFFGPNGQFELQFENPILPWILKSRHQRDNNDPDWQQDYEFYQQACHNLKLISNK